MTQAMKKFTQQIDVFAADEETVLIIECKSAESIKEHSFKTYIEKMHGIFPGISNEIRKRYPGAKDKANICNSKLCFR